MSTTFSQYYHNKSYVAGLLFAITSGQESNFNSGLKLKTCHNLLIKICCENLVNIYVVKMHITSHIAIPLVIMN